MTRIRRKKTHHGIRDIKRGNRTRARTKDLDQIHQDLETPNKFKELPLNEDLPGLGQFYCIECAKYFISDEAKKTHLKSKVHRRRLKELKDGPYTQKDAEAAVGLATDNGESRRNKVSASPLQ